LFRCELAYRPKIIDRSADCAALNGNEYRKGFHILLSLAEFLKYASVDMALSY
jgi:hypothetical protein